MKEYKCIKICSREYETEQLINELARHNWKIVCSYYGGGWLIMERDIK